MRIWLVTIGEPIIYEHNRLRLHRTGIVAKLISETSNHQVIWWTSAYNHFLKVHTFPNDTILEVNENLRIIALKGKGYKRNISLNRIVDHNQIAIKFEEYVDNEPRPDIIVAAFPPLALCWSAVKYARSNNVPIIVDYRDLWPEVFVDILPGPIKLLGKLILYPLFQRTNKLFMNSTGIIGITDDFLRIGLEKAQRSRVFSDNVFSLAYLENQFTNEDYLKAVDFWNRHGITNSNGMLNLCFFGTIGYQFEFETIIKAATIIKSRTIKFIICGTGDLLSKLKNRSTEMTNIIFPGYISAAQIKALMDLSHIGICPYIPKKAFLSSIPGKAIEYFSSGLYVLSTLGNGVLGKLLEKNGFGANYDSNNPNSLVECIDKSMADINDSKRIEIRNYFLNNFDAKIVYASYLRHLENVVNYKCNYKNA